VGVVDRRRYYARVGFHPAPLWLHPPTDGVWNPPNRARIERAVSSILEWQLPDGGFNIYPNGPADVSASVKAYFALKLVASLRTIRAWRAAVRRSSRWGGSIVEQLRQDQPEPFRTLPARALSGGAAGDHAAAG